MTVKELYGEMEKRSNWSFTIYVDGISDNILAYANDHYDVDGSNKRNYIYSVKIYLNMK